MFLLNINARIPFIDLSPLMDISLFWYFSSAIHVNEFYLIITIYSPF